MSLGIIVTLKTKEPINILIRYKHRLNDNMKVS